MVIKSVFFSSSHKSAPFNSYSLCVEKIKMLGLISCHINTILFIFYIFQNSGNIFTLQKIPNWGSAPEWTKRCVNQNSKFLPLLLNNVSKYFNFHQKGIFTHGKTTKKNIHVRDWEKHFYSEQNIQSFIYLLPVQMSFLNKHLDWNVSCGIAGHFPAWLKSV